MTNPFPTQAVHRFEACVALLGFFLLALVHLENTVFGYPLWRLVPLLPPFYLLLVGLLLLRLRRALLIARSAVDLWLLVGLAAASASWSAFPDRSLEQAGLLAGTTLLGLYLATTCSTATMLRLLAVLTGFLLVVNVAVGLLSSDQAFLGIALDAPYRTWQGIFKHKNTLGVYSVLGVLVFNLLRRYGELPRSVAWSGLIVAGGMGAISGSRTAMVLGFVVLVAGPVWRSVTRLRRVQRVLLGAIVVTTSLAAIGLLKDPLTLSGRVELWDVLISSSLQRPWLGHGYEAFWVPAGPADEVYRSLMEQMTHKRPRWNTVWYPRHAHNGFLNLTLELGVLGLVVVCAGLVRALRNAVPAQAAERGLGAEWSLHYLAILTLLYNLVETTIAAPNNLFWCLYAAIAFRVSAPRVALDKSHILPGLTPARIVGGVVLTGAAGFGAMRFIDAQHWFLAQARNGTGLQLIEQGQYDPALRVLEEASALRPDWHAPHVNLGIAYQRMGEDSLALEHFNSAVQKDTDSGEALGYRGEYFLAQRRFEDARRDLEESMARGSAGLRHYKGIATAYAGLGSAPSCLRYTRMFVQAGGDLGAHIVTISEPFFGDPANLAAGLEYFMQLEQELPDRWWVPYNIGTLADRLGKSGLAREAYARAEVLRVGP